MNRMMHQMEIEPEDHDLCKKAFVMAIRDALDVISGKWKLAIVCTLLSGPKGFADIERLLGTISPRMLARELRELEINGAITRVGSDGRDKSRKYVLTKSGEKLEQVVFMLAQWGKDHRALVAETEEAEADRAG